jgi:hypothetical protein
MKKLIYWSLFIPGFLFTSCAPEPEHLYPLSYLPAYPGSYWKYVDAFGDTAEATTDGTYELQSAPGEGSFYVPVYDDLFFAKKGLWGYRLRYDITNSTGYYPFHKLLDEETPAGGMWSFEYSQYYALKPKVIARDATVVVNGTSYYPTIVIEYWGIPSNAWQTYKLFTYYFAKDVGVVKVENYDRILHDFGEFDSLVNTYSLYEYSIAEP